MNRLPLPNWNCTPNINPTGNFSAILNVGYGSLPFTGQHYRPLPSQMFFPRPPVHTNLQETTFPVNGNYAHEPSKMSQCQALPSKPEDFSCDVCERSFKTKQILDTHIKSHVKCDYEGCSFFASRKMLKLHFIQNHAKGRMRIKLDTPEEIEKWREQRRKRYPTFANIQKKIAEEKARRESGQIAETQTFRYQGKKQRNNRRFNRQKHSKFQKPARHQSQFNNSNSEVNQCDVKMNETKETVGDPLSLLLVNSNAESDSEEKLPHNTTPQTSASVSTSALASLCSYGGDSSGDESDANEEVNNNNQVSNPIQSVRSHERKPENTEFSPQPQKVSRKRKQDLKKNKGAKSRKVTLLQKLLAPEIRHENNVILQCIRYIVKNNYFDAK